MWCDTCACAGMASTATTTASGAAEPAWPDVVAPTTRAVLDGKEVTFTPVRGLPNLYSTPSTFYVIASTFHLSMDPATWARVVEVSPMEVSLCHTHIPQAQRLAGAQNAPRALREVTDRHPMMRAHIVQNPAHLPTAPGRYFAIVDSLSEGALRGMLHVIVPTATATRDLWQRVVFDRTNMPYARDAAETLWDVYLIAAAPGEPEGSGHLILCWYLGLRGAGGRWSSPEIPPPPPPAVTTACPMACRVPSWPTTSWQPSRGMCRPRHPHRGLPCDPA